MQSFEEVASFIRQNEVGRRAWLETPYGRRILSYADLTATGRYLHFVEAWIRRVRPFYANSHTSISSTGRVMTELREEARRVIKKSVNAGADDEVLFVGSGATAAINKLVGLLGLRISEPLERQYRLSQLIPPSERPVIFVGPYEHHSNELPWLESVAEVVEVGLTPEGAIDLEHLETVAKKYAARPLKVGAFSAASNVTGVLSNVQEIARRLHRHGAYAVFDFAAAGPYVPIDLHPADAEARLDAVFLSCHKFIGGPEGSGLLVVNRSLFRTRSPERPGGGTVDYVAAFDSLSVDYTRKLDEREEGGTPAILGDLRAGIGFLVKEMAGPARILEHEKALAAYAVKRLSRHPRIKVLGPQEQPRLAIISFNIERLHHDLVSALLDHLFGIQNRAGCSCAGPYGHRLLGVDRAMSEQYRQQVARGVLGIKPGWVRVTLPYYASEEDVEFLLSAIEFIADHGRVFVPEYRLGWLDGVWRHIDRPMSDVMPLELTVDALVEAAQSFAAGDHEAPMSMAQLRVERKRYFDEAKELVAELGARWAALPLRWNPGTGRPDVDGLVWFDYVHCDAPWDRVPLTTPERDRPMRCHAHPPELSH
ncbi:MAG: aminotransferase class V-fold PLP-dependent enzyme [Myxococcaceae bacterium]|nr:aminotransferase class V-fold PLP-dependent enzyme [Myxococcaceae bacterium]